MPYLTPHPAATAAVATDKLSRRRKALSIDYQHKTHAWLEAHGTDLRQAPGAMAQCLATLRRQCLPHYFSSPPRWRMWARTLLKERALPDFCIIGPMKSGTSDLAVTIMSHPNVIPPLVKEFRSTDPIAWKPFYPTLRAVQRHAQRHGVALSAFVEPCLHCLDIPLTLSSLRPNTKIIINLRNPVDLVFSQWKWYVLLQKQHVVDRVPFLSTYPAYVQKALELFPECPAPFGSPLHSGMYATSVGHWLRAFGERNVRIFDVAEYFADRDSYFERLEAFLGLPHVQLPPRLPIANANPLAGLTAAPEASERLRHFFEPHNRRLWDVIGTAYSW